MTLTKEQFQDLDMILETLMSAFNDAEADKRGTMTLQSKRGSKFNERVQRLYDAVLEAETTEPK